ncbi:Cof-type HAD-IIB family hydrolase [Spiroplasma cantharicola]|uniref:HAD family hydrolase n=1 Tax=Spiroplasma cantharicola TaxID=362837 RepID=A0A0M3SJE9_9MOLU|nr:Cof-type HAD-IIB family hydrolase [Spiroplasma cantharicola]ALD66614.1 HAD family hydrolase [Spiroplasma cantharicola]
MKLPYIGSDLDGTIVKNSDFKILDETVNNINEYQNLSENKLFVVTGRSLQNIKYYIKQLNIKLPVVCSNGAVVLDPITWEVYYEHLMQKEIIVDLINYAIEHDLDISLYTPTSVCSLTVAERIKTYKKLYGHYPDDCQPDFILYQNYHQLLEDVKKDTHKIIRVMYSLDFTKELEKANNLKKYLESKNLYYPSTIIQSRFLIDAMPKGINKATGIKKWAEIMKVDLKDIHVIGDNNNDFEMVSEMPFGLAVANASEKLKKAAWKVIDTIENNGVGKYLKELISKG